MFSLGHVYSRALKEIEHMKRRDVSMYIELSKTEILKIYVLLVTKTII